MYKLIIDEDVKEVILRLEKKEKTKYLYLQKKIRQLADNPYHGKPLRNVLNGRWRVHLGEQVLIYSIDEDNKTLTLLKLAHHDEVYF